MKKQIEKDRAEQFQKDLGGKAVVEHHSLSGEEQEHAEKLREVLSDIAKDLQRVRIITPGLEYLGSFSVHVFASEALRSFEFISLTAPNKATHPVAEAALSKLREDVNAHYTGKRRKLRSGW